MLVPHEPDADPRIGWVADLCTAVADTVILGATWSTDRPRHAYCGEALVERIYIPDIAGKRAKALALMRGVKGAVRKLPPTADHSQVDSEKRVVDGAAGAGRLSARLARLSSLWMKDWMRMDALYRRARAESNRPDLIVCHDLPGLVAGARLKTLWSVPLLYDAHEYWPQADLLQEPWAESLLTRVERRLIGKADQVVTVSPPLATHLECVYGIVGVLSVPNAGPEMDRPLPSRAPDGRVRFLLQGQLMPGRGFELLLDAWAEMDTRAVLQLRYLPNEYATGIERRYAPLLESGRVEKLAPVSEEKLVEAAAEADVGVVPYVGPSLNHVYACPNKVSQYMQAGLGLLASSEMLYVASLLKRFACGMTYDPRRPETLRTAVDVIVGDPQELSRMRSAAATAAETEFNWEVVSKPYSDAITRLLGTRQEVPEEP
jgi:glycosyltransferase involved in cell wall biosynthesis